MKVALFAVALLLAGCASARPPTLNNTRSDAPSPSATRNSSTYNRDALDCERQAALASAGSKAQAFDSCMRARNQMPKRP